MMEKMLQKISKPIESDLEKFDDFFNNSLLSDVKIINTVIKYIVRKKGKRLRPRLCLLSAQMCGQINSNTYKVASLLEILHKFKKDFHKEIMLATFIENRRWNLLLEGSLLLKLSETDIRQSIENYIKLTNNLSYNNLIDVMMIDLRDPQKAVIEYK